MKFNYTTEKNKFEKQWERLEKEYREAGMAEDAIVAMREYDWEQFKKERNYCIHTQFMETGREDLKKDIDDEADVARIDKSSFLKRFEEKLSVEPEEYCPDTRYGWMEQIGDGELYGKLKALKPKDLELFHLYAIEGFKVTEIARMMGLPHSDISRKLGRIRKRLQ